MLAGGRDLDVVAGAETLERFDKPRASLDLYGDASYLAELLLLLTEDGEETPAIIDLLLRLLCEGIDPFLVARNCELSLCELLGFAPRLQAYVSCQAAIEPAVNSPRPKLGGMLCPNCRSAGRHAVRLSVNAQKFLRVLSREGRAGAIKLRLDPATVGEVERALPKVMRSIREGLPSGGNGVAYNSTK